jgi:hypothetical protein
MPEAVFLFEPNPLKHIMQTRGRCPLIAAGSINMINRRQQQQQQTIRDQQSVPDPFALKNNYDQPRGQSLWLLIMRSRVRFPLYHGNFPLRGRIPMVTMVWVLGRFRLRTPLAFHLRISPLT